MPPLVDLLLVGFMLMVVIGLATWMFSWLFVVNMWWRVRMPSAAGSPSSTARPR